MEIMGHINITIKYMKTKATKATPVNVAFPKKAVQSGTCAKKGTASVAKIMLTFKNITFTWSFNVEKDNSWTTQSMHVFVNLKNNTLFPQAAHDIINVSSSKSSNVEYIKAQKQMSYSCSTSKSYPIGKDVDVTFENIQVQPFPEENNKFSKADVCDKPEPKKKTNNIVPIAVGCALAGLIVIVLIAYLIGRRKTSRGYQQV